MHDLAQELLKKEQIKRIPSTSFIRMWSLGSSQARIGASFLLYALRKNFLQGDARQQALNQTKLMAAIQLLGTMGYLRGAIMKMGQLLANLPQLLDDELLEILESLHFEAPPMHFSLIRELFLNELGREPEELFAFFEKRAFAAASLGQVHRARLHDGTEVAVKIQYPNIGRTIAADLRTLGVLLQTMRLNKDYHYLKEHILDARKVFMREVDYLTEAQYMEKNRNLFAGSQIVVPRYFPEFTTRKVLTMEFLSGKNLRNFLEENPSQAKRNHFGELVSQALVDSFFQLQTVYADLHPGNFLFMNDGRLGFIDFGCHQQFSKERWRLEMESELAMLNNDMPAIHRFLAKVTLHENANEIPAERLELLERQVEWLVKPIKAQGLFDFGDKHFVNEGMVLLKAMLQQKGGGRSDSFYNWTNRAIVGHRSFMFRLQCQIDYGAMYRKHLQQVLR